MHLRCKVEIEGRWLGKIVNKSDSCSCFNSGLLTLVTKVEIPTILFIRVTRF